MGFEFFEVFKGISTMCCSHRRHIMYGTKSMSFLKDEVCSKLIHCLVRVEFGSFKFMKKGHLEETSALIVDVV